MISKVLITGASSFVGSHIADMLINAHNYEVHGLVRPRCREDFLNKEVTYYKGDITDYTAVSGLIKELQPDYIYHMAAQSFVPLSWEAPQMTMDTNFGGSLNILEAVRWYSPETKILMAGTSEEYGHVFPEECPVNERQPLRPMSPYGVSKVAMDKIAMVYHKSYGINVIVTRAFNHTGPRRGEEFVTSKIAKRMAMIYLGLCASAIELGNMEAVRDFTDVRDTIRAYRMLLEGFVGGEVYNIGTGKAYSIQQVFDLLQQISGINYIHVIQNPKYMRPAEVPLLVCDPWKINTLNWRPHYTFEQTMTDLYNYWIDRLKK